MNEKIQMESDKMESSQSFSRHNRQLTSRFGMRANNDSDAESRRGSTLSNVSSRTGSIVDKLLRRDSKTSPPIVEASA